MKKRRQLKPFVLPLLYLFFVAGLVMITSLSYNETTTNDENLTYVSGSVFDSSIPVVSTSEAKIAKPFTNDKVTIDKSFYDHKADSKNQENSIIKYEDTYMQNSGISYSCTEEFPVIAVLDGTVIKVTENELLGKTVEIRHDSNLISVYHSLSDIKVAEGDFVSQNQLLGKSGTSKIFNSQPNKLHFEIIHNGKHVNPESLYDKALKDL